MEAGKQVCVHCGSGPADYSDGFNGVVGILGCGGFHCFDCARIKHKLAYPGPGKQIGAQKKRLRPPEGD